MSKEHEATDDSEIFEKTCHLHLTVISAPAGVVHKRGERGEDNEHPRSLASPVIEHEHETTTELEYDSDDKRDSRNRHRESDISESSPNKSYHVFEVEEESKTTDYK